MLKTNTGIVRDRVTDYIVKCLEDWNDECTRRNLARAVEEWKQWRRSVTPAEFLTNYAIVFDCYCSEQRKLLKEWLEETEEEANRFDDLQVETLFLRLIDRELKVLFACYEMEVWK